MPLPPIIDAHHHFYDLSRFRYPFLDDPEFAALRRTYGPADFRADGGDLPVIGSVHVQGEIDHACDPVAETAWLADVVKVECCGLPSVAVAYADLRHAGLADLLARHAAYSFVRGIRQEAWFDPASTRADIPRDDFLKDVTWRRGYRRLADFGMSFDLLVWPWQLTEAARFVAAVPEVPVMVEHMGCPVDRSPDGVRVWRDGLRAMAGVAHAYLKLSAMSLLGPSWTIGAVGPFILDAIDAFGLCSAATSRWSGCPAAMPGCGRPALK